MIERLHSFFPLFIFEALEALSLKASFFSKSLKFYGKLITDNCVNNDLNNICIFLLILNSISHPAFKQRYGSVVFLIRFFPFQMIQSNLKKNIFKDFLKVFIFLESSET